VLVDLNGRAYDLPGDIILAGVQIAAPLIDFCHGITHLQLMIELGYGIKPQRLCGGSIERWWNPGVYGNRTAESRERTEDERTETTIYPRSNCMGFLRLDGKEC
jgi:hypothetical protein